MAEHPEAETFFPERRNLKAFRAAVQGCRACPLYRDATQAVFGEGPRNAPLMLVGETPGDEEDRAGRPFVGGSGRLLDQLLEEAGIERKRLFVTNAVKHFKFERRGKWRIHKTPGATEVRACLPWLEAEAEMVAPEMIVCLGSTAAKAVIGPDVRITKDRGRVFETAFAPWTLPTYHPSAALRAPDELRAKTREALLEDLKKTAERLREIAA
jgi:uracil-DNA glycosylase family protein